MELFYAVNVLKIFKKLNELYNNSDLHKGGKLCVKKQANNNFCNKQVVEFAESRQFHDVYALIYE